MSARLAVLAVLLVATGCASSQASVGCDVETNVRRGRGVIVGPRTVLTVCHVVAGEESGVTVDSRPARIVRRHLRETDTGDDGIAVLELEEGEFPRERIATVAPRANAGITYLPARGSLPWPWGIQPGDSGSPILDAQGNVTGLVRAVYGRAEALDRTMTSPLLP